MEVHDLQTPALVVDAAVLDANLLCRRAAGTRLRPHVKAHKCTALGAPPGRPRHARLHLRHHP